VVRLFCQATERPIIKRKMLARRQLAPGGIVITALCMRPAATCLSCKDRYCHLTGDFGTRGMPGVFKIFFVDVVLNMARAAHVLTIPMSVYVDDLCATGPKASTVTRRVVVEGGSTGVCAGAARGVRASGPSMGV
jgi:hypothetical protein